MTFQLLLRDSTGWTLVFFVLFILAVLTQLPITESLTYVVRGPLKAAPALFLAALSWHFHGPPLLTLAFLLCAAGDILLDTPKTTLSSAFEAGAGFFAAALICLSLSYLEKPYAGRSLLPLSFANFVIAVYVAIWVYPVVKRTHRIAGVAYLTILVASNVIAATSLIPVFLGSTLWLLSDLSIAVGRHIPGTPSNGPTNLAIYALGLYFLALGFLNV